MLDCTLNTDVYSSLMYQVPAYLPNFACFCCPIVSLFLYLILSPLAISASICSLPFQNPLNISCLTEWLCSDIFMSFIYSPINL